jgi:hypothetical protein
MRLASLALPVLAVGVIASMFFAISIARRTGVSTGLPPSASILAQESLRLLDISLSRAHDAGVPSDVIERWAQARRSLAESDAGGIFLFCEARVSRRQKDPWPCLYATWWDGLAGFELPQLSFRDATGQSIGRVEFHAKNTFSPTDNPSLNRGVLLAIVRHGESVTVPTDDPVFSGVLYLSSDIADLREIEIRSSGRSTVCRVAHDAEVQNPTDTP